MSIPAIRKSAHSRLQPLVEALSFKKQSEGIFFLELDNNVLGRLGLPDVNRGNVLGIYPVVGLRHLVLEALCAELVGERPKKYGSSTVGSVMGYLMPQHTYMEWRFSGQNDDDSSQGLIDAIQTYGIHFMRENASLERIDRLMESYDYIYRHVRAKKWPVAKLLLGRRDEAMQVMDEYIHLLKSEGRDKAVEDHEKYRALIIEKADWIVNYTKRH